MALRNRIFFAGFWLLGYETLAQQWLHLIFSLFWLLTCPRGDYLRLRLEIKISPLILILLQFINALGGKASKARPETLTSDDQSWRRRNVDGEKNRFRFKVCNEWVQICLLRHSKFIRMQIVISRGWSPCAHVMRELEVQFICFRSILTDANANISGLMTSDLKFDLPRQPFNLRLLPTCRKGIIAKFLNNLWKSA